MQEEYQRRPHWLKVPHRAGENYQDVRRLVQQRNLHTVCQSAHCPNIGECWGRRTATFMILGDVCTRNCGFCAVQTGHPHSVDEDEPLRVAEAIYFLKLKYTVITSVTRDDLPDGGARIFAKTIRAIHEKSPACEVEVLIPDFQGSESALRVVLDAEPAVLNHNLETVPRLYAQVRSKANYDRSLNLLTQAKNWGATTKTGIMLGVGETIDEVRKLMSELQDIECDILTIGQYMQPDKNHIPIKRFVPPREFEMLKQEALGMGFQSVESAPLVRSSYHADNALKNS